MSIMDFFAASSFLIVFAVALLALLAMSIRVANQYERSGGVPARQVQPDVRTRRVSCSPLIEWQTTLDLRTKTTVERRNDHARQRSDQGQRRRSGTAWIDPGAP